MTTVILNTVIVDRIQTLSNELAALPWWRIFKRWEIKTRISINRDLLRW